MSILCIDTATPTCAIGLFQEGKLLLEASIHQQRAAASELLPMIDAMLKSASVSKHSITAVALAKGPGSYTGLRVATSTAKSLCYALNIPLIGVDSLEAMAASMMQVNEYAATDLLVPMIDARRMEVYQAVYNTQGVCLLPTEAHVLAADDFSNWIQEGHTLHLFGTGALKCKTLFSHKQLRISNGLPSAIMGLGSIAAKRLAAGQTEDLAYFEPFYLKSFQGQKSTGHKLLKQQKEKNRTS